MTFVFLIFSRKQPFRRYFLVVFRALLIALFKYDPRVYLLCVMRWRRQTVGGDIRGAGRQRRHLLGSSVG